VSQHVQRNVVSKCDSDRISGGNVHDKSVIDTEGVILCPLVPRVVDEYPQRVDDNVMTRVQDRDTTQVRTIGRKASGQLRLIFTRYQCIDDDI